MKLRHPILYVCVIVLGLGQSMANAEVHKRYVRMTLDPSQLTSGAGYVELSTGFSDTFKPAQLTGTDMLNVHAEFFDPQGNQLYVVLRDLGGEYLNNRGWQWFQAAVGLDVGTVSGTYVNGWVFTESLPRRLGNAACCTRTAVSQSVIESAGFGYEVTDSSIAIESMRFQFNFNHYTDPVVITDGGGFNRLSVKMRSEDIALVRKPYMGWVDGPWDDAGNFIDVDGNGLGNDRKVAVGYAGAQHFLYIIHVYPGIPSSSDFSYPIFLPDGFVFDPIGEQNFDGCADGICDGLSGNTNPACVATISGPAAKKKQIEARNAVIEIIDTFSGNSCGYKVHVVTTGEAKGRNASYYPSDCRTAETSTGDGIHSLVKVTNGVQIHDNISRALLRENLGEQLEPVGCP